MPAPARFSRRHALHTLALSAAGWSASRFLPAFAADLAADPARRRHCILLWMTGGPSQTDTFDMKPGHANGGPFKEIATVVPGMRFSEHLPKLAAHAGDLAILRGLSTKEGDHQRATELMHTGHLPMGPIRYPTIGSSLSKSLARGESDLPGFVSVRPFLPYNSGSPGFLGAAHAPLTVGTVANYGVPQQPQQPPQGDGYATLTVDDARPRPAYLARQETRVELWRALEADFLERNPHATAAAAHRTVYERAIRFMTGTERALDAFDLSQEPEALRQAYGPSGFGQGCLLARRLIERGVAFVEVAMSDATNFLVWDTHQDNFNQVKKLSAELDAGWGTLLADLKQRGLLESTTILWMGEFGRTPVISIGGGREHFTDAWSAVLAGGGIQGGAVHGRTSADGRAVEDGRIEVGDLLATLAAAVGVKPETENVSEMGRPIKIAEGRPVDAILA